MGGEQAASVLAQVKQEQLERQGRKMTAEEIDAVKAPVLAKYEEEGARTTRRPASGTTA
jgi:3-methylcrotonyl-CoA carboxylase beta subunit